MSKSVEVRLTVPHVLYLNLDPEQREAFSYALLDHAQVVMAASIADAQAGLLAHPKITVIVTDLHLGRESGLAALARLYEINMTTVNILVTGGFSDAAAFAQALNSGLVWRVYNKTSSEYTAPGALERIVREAAREQARRRVEDNLAVAARDFMRRFVRKHEEPDKDGRVARRELLCQLLRPYLDLSALERALLPVAALARGVASVFPVNPFALLGDPDPAVGLPGLTPLFRSVEDARERFDGTGPQGRSGEAIAALGRVLAVVDQFDRLMAAWRASLHRERRFSGHNRRSWRVPISALFKARAAA